MSAKPTYLDELITRLEDNESIDPVLLHAASGQIDGMFDELAQLRADLQAERARREALENDIVCAFCGTHYHADDVPPQHYLTCEASPLVRRIAEQARQLEEARIAFQKIVDLGNKSHAAFDGERWHQMRKVASMALNPLEAHPAPSAEPQHPISAVELAAYRYYLGESDDRLRELFDDMPVDERERYHKANAPQEPQP